MFFHDFFGGRTQPRISGVEKGEEAQLVDKAGKRRRQARRAHLDRSDEAVVADRLGEDPTEPEHHAGTELGIPDEAGDQLALAAHHLGDEQRDLTILRPRGGEQRLGLGRHRRHIAEADANEPALRLVGDSVPGQLEHDRKADLGRRRGGRGRVPA